MVLVRVWRLQLLGGMGTALIVPGALIGALAALALAGGFGGIAALGQVLSGPSLPGGTPASARGASVPRPVPAALLAALATTPAAAIRPSPGGGSHSSSGTGTAPRGGTPTPSVPRAPRGGRGGVGAPAPRGTSGTGRPAPAPQP